MNKTIGENMEISGDFGQQFIEKFNQQLEFLFACDVLEAH